MRMALLVSLLVVGCGGSSANSDGGVLPGADAAPGTPDAAPGTPDAAPGGSVWHPTPDTTWQWQLTGTIDTSIDVQMYDVDLFTTPAATIDTLHAAGRKVICYFSAGSYEPDRPDSGDFPAAALGNVLDGWPDEKWLDVRRADVRAIMGRRLDRAVAAHCDGVEPDNVDGFDNDNGFSLGAADQLDYNRFLATEAHARQLSVGLKNDLGQVPALVGDFDWSLDEECHKYNECDALTPFISAGKAVFHAEYVDASMAAAVCAVTKPLHLSTIIKKIDLDAYRVACP
jgi:hypothetical protein